jgi:hypothetical protein
MAPTLLDSRLEEELSPLVLFAQLQLAVESGDHEAAAAAQRQLARLGIVVRFGRPRAEGKEVAHAAR